MTGLMLYEHGFATLFNGREITTTRLHENRYVRIDDGREYPQLCNKGRLRGGTLIYSTPEQLAKDCCAKLFTDRAEYEVAKARLKAQWDAEDAARDAEYGDLL